MKKVLAIIAILLVIGLTSSFVYAFTQTNKNAEKYSAELVESEIDIDNVSDALADGASTQLLSINQENAKQFLSSTAYERMFKFFYTASKSLATKDIYDLRKMVVITEVKNDLDQAIYLRTTLRATTSKSDTKFEYNTYDSLGNITKETCYYPNFEMNTITIDLVDSFADDVSYNIITWNIYGDIIINKDNIGLYGSRLSSYYTGNHMVYVEYNAGASNFKNVLAQNIWNVPEERVSKYTDEDVIDMATSIYYDLFTSKQIDLTEDEDFTNTDPNATINQFTTREKNLLNLANGYFVEDNFDVEAYGSNPIRINWNENLRNSNDIASSVIYYIEIRSNSSLDKKFLYLEFELDVDTSTTDHTIASSVKDADLIEFVRLYEYSYSDNSMNLILETDGIKIDYSVGYNEDSLSYLKYSTIEYGEHSYWLVKDCSMITHGKDSLILRSDSEDIASDLFNMFIAS